MLFDQYIFTSWQNGDSLEKGFTIFAKSQGVTFEECKEIENALGYCPPKSLPLCPTKEQIDEIFPKNFAFFKLKSGRYCIAQTSYVGRDYTFCTNPRWGNYIIHAFIGDIQKGFNPSTYINSDVFKIGLTVEEQNYPQGPNELEPLEIDLIGNQVKSTSFDYSEQFFQFVQGIITAIQDDKNLFVSIPYENIKDWVIAATEILPATMIDDFSFSTYLLSPSPMFKVNFIHQQSEDFSPAEQIQKGNLCICQGFDNFSRDNIELGDFVKYIKTLPHEEISSVKDKIEQITHNFKTNLDLATNIYRFFKKDKEIISNHTLSLSIIDAFPKNQAVSTLCYDVLKNCPEELMLEGIKRIYSYSDKTTKNDIKNEIFEYLTERASKKDYDFVIDYLENHQIFTDDLDTKVEFIQNLLNTDCWADIEFSTYILNQISYDLKLYISCLVQTIRKGNLNSWEFISTIEKNIENAICSKENDLEIYLQQYCKDYMVARDRFRFYSSDSLSNAQICDYFSRYILVSKDNATINEFNQKLNRVVKEKNPSEILDICEKFIESDTQGYLQHSTFNILYDNAFKGLNLKSMADFGFTKAQIKEINGIASALGIQIIPVTAVYTDFLTFYERKEAIAFDELYYPTRQCPKQLKAQLFSMAGDKIFDYIAKRNYNQSKNDAFEDLTLAFTEIPDWKSLYYQQISSKTKTEHILLLLEYSLSVKNRYSREIHNEILLPFFKKQSKKERKLLFDALAEISDNPNLISLFAEEFNNHNKSIIDKMKDLFSKEKNTNKQENQK